MGLHTGDSEHRSGDYYGSVVNRAARLMAAAHAGQILVSQATAALARDGLPPTTDLVDLGELELRDLRRPEWVFQVVHPDLPREFPPLRALQQLAGNLPVPVTSFLGRERELALVAEALADHAWSCSPASVASERRGWRCKRPWTRRPSLPTARGGASWPALASPTPSPTSSRQASVSRPTGRFPPIDMLTDFLAGKQLLLVLDNCEHLLEAAAHLVLEIEHRCPRCDGVGDEPRGTRDRRRAHLVGAVARDSRGRCVARRGGGLRSGASLRRTRACGECRSS